MRYYWYTCLVAVIAHGTLKSCGSGRLKQWPCLVNLVIYATLALRIARVYCNTFPKSMVGCRNVGTQCCVWNLCVRMSWLAAKCDTMSATTAPPGHYLRLLRSWGGRNEATEGHHCWGPIWDRGSGFRSEEPDIFYSNPVWSEDLRLRFSSSKGRGASGLSLQERSDRETFSFAVVGAHFAPDGFGWKRCGLCTWQVSNASICSVLVALYMCLVFVSNYVRTSIIRFRTSHLFVLTVLSFYILLIN